MLKQGKYRRDSGFTIIEVVVVIAIISIMTNLFTNILVSATQIYVDNGIRKTRHIDSRRVMEMATRDLRELNTWTSAASSMVLDFDQVDNFHRTLLFTTYTHYDLLRTRYNISSPTFTYQNETGSGVISITYLTVM